MLAAFEKVDNKAHSRFLSSFLWFTYTIAKVKDKLMSERNCRHVVVNVGHGLRMVHSHMLDNIVK